MHTTIRTWQAYIVAAPDTRFAEPTLPLIAEVLGAKSVPLRGPMEGNASPLCAHKAIEKLGVTPRSWRDQQPPPPPPAVAPAAALPPFRGSSSAVRARADPHLQHFALDGFVLDSGATLPAGATLAYRVHGRPIGSGQSRDSSSRLAACCLLLLAAAWCCLLLARAAA